MGEEVCGVPKGRVLTISLALFLAAGGYVPLAARGSALHDEAHWDGRVSVSVAVPEATTAASGADDTTGGERREEVARPKGNGFVRAVTAPFRALARLFGGGDRKDSAKAQRKTMAPRTESATRAASPDVATKREEGASGPWQPVPVSVPAATAAARPYEGAGVPAGSAARREESINVVRPGAGGSSVAPGPKRFIPIIEGIPKDPLSQGRALLQHGYLSEAISELSVAATSVDVSLNLVEANNLLGLAYDRIGWHAHAIQAYERALAVAPKDPVLLANLGYSLYLNDNYPMALRRLKQAAKLSPNVPVIHNNVGIVQARMGKYDEAFKSFARASNEYDAHLKLGDVLETAGRSERAAKHFESALRIQPGSTQVLERLVAIYERTGQTDKANTARRALGKPRNPQRTTTGG